MEYDFETGPDDEVMEREKQRARERYLGAPGGVGAAIAPLVRIILALLAALGVQSVREALRRIEENDDTLAELRRSLGVMRHNYETSPMMKVAGEIAAAMGMPNASAADLLARVKALFVPVDVEADIDALVAENADASIENPLTANVRRSPAPETGLPSDPARVSLPATRATADGELDADRDAFFRGVEQGRREALDHPSGFVLVFEDGLPSLERARVADLCRSVRGVVAALPVADVVTLQNEKGDRIKRSATLAVELISARATNTKLERRVKRLITLVRALRAQRADAREQQSNHATKLSDAQVEIARLSAQRDETAKRALSTENLPPDSEMSQATAERKSRFDFEQRVMAAMDIEQQAPAERLCVAVLVTDPVGRVALIESAKPGRAWEIPGGKVKEGETPRAAAVREVAEEMGVQLTEDALEPAGILRGTPKPGAAFASVIHVFRARAEGELRAGSDAKGASWLHASAVLDLHANGRLSDLQITHDVLLPWAREAVGGAS